MKIGIVIHGPEVIDSGYAVKMIDRLSLSYKVHATLGGTMGKVAILDAKLDTIIDIDNNLRPGRVIEHFFDHFDAICLLNQGKTLSSGVMFGSILTSTIADRDKKPFIQVERPDHRDGGIICRNDVSEEFAQDVSDLLDLPVLILEDDTLIHRERIVQEGNRIIRNVACVHPGELIMVEGIVIGKAISEDVSIVVEEGFIKELKGAVIKEHGVEKLHEYEKRVPVDISRAWVKTGSIRRSSPMIAPVLMNDGLIRKGLRKGFNAVESAGKEYKIAFIDHCADRAFELASGCDLALTVGDDTTSIAADILYRLGIPIIGITDGDQDGFSHNMHVFPGSVIFQVEDGYDDILGKKVMEELDKGFYIMDRNIPDFLNLKELVKELIYEKLVSVIEY